MFMVHGERGAEAHLVEVPASPTSLRAHGIFVVIERRGGGADRCWLWIGSGATSANITAARHLVKQFDKK